MKTIYLSGQNNFGNRGCEALVRTTVRLLREHLGDVTVLVPSLDIKRDAAQWPEATANGVEFVKAETPPKSWVYWDRLCRRVPAMTRFPMPKLHPSATLQACLNRIDALLVIGGDNYSLDYGLVSLAYFVGEAEAAIKRSIPTLLWGASVGPFTQLPNIERQMLVHMRRLSKIAVRESASINYLKQFDLSEKIIPVTDPAFLLQPEEYPTQNLFDNPAGVLGLNFSPLIQRRLENQGKPNEMQTIVSAFIRRVTAKYDVTVLLIPHVAPLNGTSTGNDEQTHAEIKSKLQDLGDKVQLSPTGLNAAQSKYLISRCRYFIGARTHATIAAMSTNVPVLSLAYSIKARGINRDLFGHEQYMLPIESMTEDSLWEGFQGLVSNEYQIRAYLASKLPLYRTSANAAASWLASALLKCEK